MTLLCYSIISLFIATVEAVGCPNGWTHFDGSCYLYHKESVTFAQAIKYCEAINGYLAEIESAKENTFVTTFLKQHDVGNGIWLGGNDLLVDGFWVWDRSGNPFNYTDWATGEPNQTPSERQDCLVVWKSENYQWADHYCTRSELGVFCETGATPCS